MLRGTTILPDEEAIRFLDDFQSDEKRFCVEGRTLTVDFEAHSFSFEGEAVGLSTTRWRYLKMLAINGGVVVPKETLARFSLRKTELKTVDVNTCFIRSCFEELCPGAGGQTFIRTVWGRGYMLPAPV
jgi:two-component system cell cycle response regulator CtrA